VTFEIFDSPGGSRLYGPVTRSTDGTGAQNINRGRDFPFDLVAGQYIVVTDVSTGITKALELPPLTVDAVDVENDLVSGSARPDDVIQVGLFEPTGSGGSAVATTDANGTWVANFRELNIDLEQQFVQAFWNDPEGDNATAEPDPGCPARFHGGFHWYCSIGASIENDWISAISWTPNSDVTIEVFESRGGPSIYGPVTVTTNERGGAFLSNLGFDEGVDLVPGTYIVAEDSLTDTVKALELVRVSLDRVDPDTNVVTGRAPPGAAVILSGGAPRQDTLTSDANGEWSIDYDDFGYDVTSRDAFAVTLFDDEGDVTIDELGAPIPGCVSDADTTCGSAGPDTIRETDGEIIAGRGEDTTLVTVDDSTGEVEVDTGDGADDVVVGDERRSHLVGTFIASTPRVLVRGGSGSERVVLPAHAGSLEVQVLGGDGSDRVFTRDLGGVGSGGRYRLDGGAGEDSLKGGDGRDILDGGSGHDVLMGGPGHDICYVSRGDVTRGCEEIVRRRSH
jgi:Ca2+-binding RTX toxin-like protein